MTHLEHDLLFFPEIVIKVQIISGSLTTRLILPGELQSDDPTQYTNVGLYGNFNGNADDDLMGPGLETLTYTSQEAVFAPLRDQCKNTIQQTI